MALAFWLKLRCADHLSSDWSFASRFDLEVIDIAEIPFSH